MTKHFIALIFYFVATQNNLFGQNLPPIQLDRPDQTECPFITPAKFIQIENGFAVENFHENQKAYSYPSTLWKYGVNDKLELRLITEFVSEKVNGIINTGILPITLGFKASLFEGKGFIPKTSFIGHITTSKIGSEKFQTKYIAPSFRFTMQHTLTKKISLAYNLGAEWNGETPEQIYLYTLTTGLSLTEKIGCYAELYGYLPNDKTANHRFDCGITYLINNNFMTDISGGFGLTENAPKNYISLGLSYRFKTSK